MYNGFSKETLSTSPSFTLSFYGSTEDIYQELTPYHYKLHLPMIQTTNL